MAIGGVLWALWGLFQGRIRKSEELKRAEGTKELRANLPPITAPPVSDPTPAPLPGEGLTIVLDPGHGGKDPGAVKGAVLEKDINARFVEDLSMALSDQGVLVIQTRDRFKYVSLDDRIRLANRTKPNLFLSIHCDASDLPYPYGCTVFTCDGCSLESHKYAERIEHHMAIGQSISFRGHRKAKFRVLQETTCPAVLLELGFMTNEYDLEKLLSREHRKAVVGCLVKAILGDRL